MDAENIGKQRQGAHPNGTQRYYKDPNTEDIIGVAGEQKFGERYGLDIDDSVKPQGDGHIDFKVKTVFKDKTHTLTIDVKTAKKAFNLLIKEWEINRCADILVLAEYKDNGDVNLLGWAFRSEMKKCPIKVFSSLGIRNYYKHQSELRPMGKLDKLLKNAEQIKDV